MHGIGPDLTSVAWCKSSYSDGGGGDCVEVAMNVPEVVPVRDSKMANGSTIPFSVTAWTAFIAGVKQAPRPHV